MTALLQLVDTQACLQHTSWKARSVTMPWATSTPPSSALYVQLLTHWLTRVDRVGRRRVWRCLLTRLGCRCFG